MVLGVTPVSGSSAYFLYGWETTFGTKSVAINKSFGHNVRVSSVKFDRDYEKLPSLGNVEYTKAVPRLFTGSFTVDYDLGNGWFWRHITGNQDVQSVSSGSYTHTFLDTSATPATVAKQTPSFSVQCDIDLDNDSIQALLGCKVKTHKLSFQKGETVHVSDEVEFVDISTAGSLGSNIDDSWCDPVVYADGALKVPTGTSLAEVQSGEITFNRNPEFLPSLGNFKHTKAPNQLIEYSCRATVAFEDPVNLMNYFKGGTGALVARPASTTLDLNFDNLLATSSDRQHLLSFQNVYVNPYSLTDLDPKATIKEDAEFVIPTWKSCVYKDATDNTSHTY